MAMVHDMEGHCSGSVHVVSANQRLVDVVVFFGKACQTNEQAFWPAGWLFAAGATML
jgi:hypothetical protein